MIPRANGALGFTLRMPEEDRTLAGTDELRGMLVVLLGGRTAERLLFGKVSLLSAELGYPFFCSFVRL